MDSSKEILFLKIGGFQMAWTLKFPFKFVTACAWDSYCLLRMYHRRLDRMASGPQQLSHIGSWPTWSTKEWHSYLTWGSFSSFQLKRSFQTSHRVRIKSTKDSHGDHTGSLGQLVSVLVPGGESIEPQLIKKKNHPRFASQAEKGRNLKD